MSTRKFVPEPVPVTLSDVYAMDFGRRTEDLAMWAALRSRAPDGPSCEVGVGDGRASVALPGERYGIDLDPRFVYAAQERGVEAFRGDAADPASWSLVPYDCGLVFCAYSTLFLIPHARQADVLRNMLAHVRPGGIVAVETFRPALAVAKAIDAPVGNPNGVGAPWTRRTTFDVTDNLDGTGVTRAHRLYGSDRDEWRMELDEIIYWRSTDGVAALFRESGLVDPGQSFGGEVPAGSVLTHWTRLLEASP